MIWIAMRPAWGACRLGSLAPR